MEYYDVIVEHSSNKTDHPFTYQTDIKNLRPGAAVLVPFANRKKPIKGHIYSKVNIPDENIKSIKNIVETVEDENLQESAIAIAEWMSRRYFCRLVDALSCFKIPGKPVVRERKEEKEEIFDPLPIELTEEQSAVFDKINFYIEKENSKTFLLHGVTNSGKTEVYQSLIMEALKKGRKSIVLLPEIALTKQMMERFFDRFGKQRIAVLHSKMSNGERRFQWNKAKTADIIIGARSALFAPVENIGIIVIDEEHEPSYKSDMTPKYDAVEVAKKIAKENNAVLILGSATPSFDSYYRADNKEYELVELKKRYNLLKLPEISIADMRNELKNGNKSIFSIELYKEIRNYLENDRQAILFLNRRGYASFISCRSCGFVLRCKECEISMTYHKEINKAVCHYCNRTVDLQNHCPVCESRYFRQFGIGTEKVEEETRRIFKDIKIERIDADTTKRKGSLEAMLKRFHKGESRILIGTQMIAKGIDFKNVGVVGIISADVSLNLPDFRAAERTFQLITQVAGRAGRGEEPGKVIVQTYNPDHYAICETDYKKFYKTEISIRKALDYPPFTDIITLSLGAKDEVSAEEGLNRIRDVFLKRVGKDHNDKVLLPNKAMIAKSGEYYYYQMIIKCSDENREAYSSILEGIREEILRKNGNKFLFSIEVN